MADHLGTSNQRKVGGRTDITYIACTVNFGLLSGTQPVPKAMVQFLVENGFTAHGLSRGAP